MAERIRIAVPPRRPVLIYDGECRFCCVWIASWKRITGPQVAYLTLQDPAVAQQFPEIPRPALEQAVHLVQPDGSVTRGAEAVFRSLGTNRSWSWLLLLYQRLPGLALLSETAYGVVARHRAFFSLLTRLLWGLQPGPPSYLLVRRLFLAGLALVYLCAFLSLWGQIGGLFGSHGISPAREYLELAERHFVEVGRPWGAWYALPTWCWLGASDSALQVLCASGVAVSLCLLAGVAPGLCCLLLWSIYLSLVVVGGEFLSFQWDALLLETGLLGVVVAPWALRPKAAAARPVSRIGLFLLRWLLFRLMLQSGCVKLLSGDVHWRNLTALDFHYQTQPLPTSLAWYAHHWPAGFQRACTGLLFAVELALPFFIFGPRRLRFVAGTGFVILQVWILLTGNYGFFNYLSLLLCLPLLDDAACRRIFSKRGLRPPAPAAEVPADASAERDWGPRTGLPDVSKLLRGAFAVGLLTITLSQLGAMFWPQLRPLLLPGQVLERWAAPFRSVNEYGLFAVMTTTRPEIQIEGSNDGEHWAPYEFRYKPGPLDRRPGYIAPHQPRLDWQMWFAALGTPQQNPWFTRLCVRLLQGSPEVLGLLQSNPFPDAPPRYIRAMVYQYEFTSPDERGRDGHWWKRQLLGTYLPEISLRGG